MAKPTFAKSGADTWTSDKGEGLPYRRLPVPRQILGLAEDGSVQVADLGSKIHYIDLTFTRISETNFNALLTFFGDGNVNWSKNSFTYTDCDSNARTVHLMPGSFTYEEKPAGTFTVSMQLIEPA